MAVDLLSPGWATFTAIATDNWGARSTSRLVTVQITGAAPSAPPAGDLNLAQSDAGVTTDDDSVLGLGDPVQSGQRRAGQWDPGAAPSSCRLRSMESRSSISTAPRAARSDGLADRDRDQAT